LAKFTAIRDYYDPDERAHYRDDHNLTRQLKR
jgi:hypothetical protein